MSDSSDFAVFTFYQIVQKHHSREQTALRKEVFSQIEDMILEADAQGKSLQEVNETFHMSVSELANYYESLGLFLKGGWEVFPEWTKNMMLEMLHNSTTRAWTEIKDNFDVIYPSKRPLDWAGSFQWLFKRVTEYRVQNDLN